MSIHLHPEYTGRGLGSQALDFIEKGAREFGFHSLVATICTENDRSLKLFEKFGYRQCAHFREVGFKVRRWLDIATYQKIMDGDQ